MTELSIETDSKEIHSRVDLSRSSIHLNVPKLIGIVVIAVSAGVLFGQGHIPMPTGLLVALWLMVDIEGVTNDRVSEDETS